MNPSKEFETRWLAEKLYEHFKNSGLSQRKWSAKYFETAPAGEAKVSYLLNQKRGVMFYLGVRAATKCGIDLSELQREIKK